MIVLECKYELCDNSQHTYPDDWIFGGANGQCPAADPRWLPTHYDYFDDKYQVIFTTAGPLCDEEAIDLFTWINSFKAWNPVYLGRRKPNELKATLLPIKYDAATDTALSLEKV